MNQQVLARMKSTGPKKILACDGGGILGLISVEILAKLEADLRTRFAKPDLVLADYFDFVCGTSTGAIIASCISTGMSTDQIRSFYTASGKQMFDKASLLKRLKYSYNDEPLARKLREELDKALHHTASAATPNATLGDAGLRTLLMMVMRNVNTDSPWPVSNNPLAKYNDAARPDCNLKLPLWQLVRASTAAPVFFPPEVVTFGEGTAKTYEFIFVDGGVTTYNNPAFLAFQMVTAAPYRISWPTGDDRLLIVSVGTGSAAKARPNVDADDLWLLDNAKNLPGALMNAASAGWDMACRVIGDCRFGPQIDREIEDLVPSESCPITSTIPKQFAYVRYDPDVSQDGLNKLGLADIKAEQVQVMDSVKHMPEIQRVGVAYAARNVSLKHLRGFA
ncbi:patatin-like phospholipase family protein [Ferribacterium limneticum]|uniref:patatin-like phospholipase family protein n=1 Tax=Ferribacterium limneticum TaxID=76259 RepID=UPI001CF916CD|nr:patatin-like phospholipase family protein [Ferribacterium limneticum]UCV21991.1 patatin-like phospholipase family protein [Ferribacterium limneticum]